MRLYVCVRTDAVGVLGPADKDGIPDVLDTDSDNDGYVRRRRRRRRRTEEQEQDAEEKEQEKQHDEAWV